MTAEQRRKEMLANRKRLFRGGRPNVRYATQADMGWLWAAKKMLGGEEMSQEDFARTMVERLSGYDAVFIAEDNNSRFRDGAGPVGVFVASITAQWVMEPHVEWFPWATMRNKIKSTVAFLVKHRESRKIGSLLIRSPDSKFFPKLMKYAPIRRIGVHAGGRPDGDEYLYSVRAKKRAA